MRTAAHVRTAACTETSGPDGSVTLTTPAGGRVAFNGTGAFVWNRLTRGLSPEAIADDVCRRFDVPIDRAREDVRALMESLTEHLVLRTAPTAILEHPDASGPQQLGRYFDDPDCRTRLERGHVIAEVGPARAPVTRQFFAAGVAEPLFERKLVLPCDPIEPGRAGACLVLRNRTPIRITHWFEWCQSMWRDALLHTIDVLMALAAHGLTLRTVAPWHIQYTNGRPIHISPGSIVPFKPSALLNCFDKLRRYTVPALLLAADGHGAMARALLRGNVNHGIHDGPFPHVRERTDCWRELLASQPNACGLGHLRARVESTTLPTPLTRWMNWQSDDNRVEPAEWTHRQRIVAALLDSDRPASLTDLGANRGWYARFAAARGCDVVAIEADETCANHIHASGPGTVVPVVFDLTDPTPAFGPTHEWFLPAADRLQSDMVLALALVDLLVFSRYRLTFDDLVSMMKAYTRKTLLVEFMPLEDPSRRDVWWPGSSDWYTLQTFVGALRRAFARVTVLQPVVNERALIVCDRQ
jgi:Coenzyme PQQ synthesis protein D (PqqD)